MSHYLPEGSSRGMVEIQTLSPVGFPEGGLFMVVWLWDLLKPLLWLHHAQFLLFDPPSSVPSMREPCPSKLLYTNLHLRLFLRETDLPHHALYFKYKPKPQEAFMQEGDKISSVV